MSNKESKKHKRTIKKLKYTIVIDGWTAFNNCTYTNYELKNLCHLGPQFSR